MSYILDQVDQRVRRVLTPTRRLWLETPRTLVIGFIAIHVVFLLALLPAILTGNVLGDLPLYRTWAQQGLVHQIWMGINVEWVYPIGALFPIVFAGLGGPLLYQLMWFLMTAALNALAVMVLTDAGRKISGYRSAWFFLLISFVLSPVGLLRLEGLTAPLVIMGLVLLARRPVVATALLTIATWVKVWPAAVVVAVVVASRRRITVILTGIAVTGGVVATVFALGGLKYITGFVTMQSDRAMQLEAPITTPWVWLAALGHPNTFIYQNYAIATREVSGPGTTLVASLMNPLMFIAMGAIVTLMLVALRRHHDVSQLLLVGSLALVGAFIIFNKVGSPQYMLWLAPVVIVGVSHSWHAWRAPAYMMVTIGVLTTLIFPVFYMPLVNGDPSALVLLTARNGLLIIMFGWSLVTLWRMVVAPVTSPALLSRRLAAANSRSVVA